MEALLIEKLGCLTWSLSVPWPSPSSIGKLFVKSNLTFGVVRNPTKATTKLPRLLCMKKKVDNCLLLRITNCSNVPNNVRNKIVLKVCPEKTSKHMENHLFSKVTTFGQFQSVSEQECVWSQGTSSCTCSFVEGEPKGSIF